MTLGMSTVSQDLNSCSRVFEEMQIPISKKSMIKKKIYVKVCRISGKEEQSYKGLQRKNRQQQSYWT